MGVTVTCKKSGYIPPRGRWAFSKTLKPVPCGRDRDQELHRWMDALCFHRSDKARVATAIIAASGTVAGRPRLAAQGLDVQALNREPLWQLEIAGVSLLRISPSHSNPRKT